MRNLYVINGALHRTRKQTMAIRKIREYLEKRTSNDDDQAIELIVAFLIAFRENGSGI